MACKAIEQAQDYVRRADTAEQEKIDALYEKHPQRAPRVPTSHRKWSAKEVPKEVTDG